MSPLFLLLEGLLLAFGTSLSFVVSSVSCLSRLSRGEASGLPLGDSTFVLSLGIRSEVRIVVVSLELQRGMPAMMSRGQEAEVGLSGELEKPDSRWT